MVSYREMLSHLQQTFPELTKVLDKPNDTSKVWTSAVFGQGMGRIGTSMLCSFSDLF